MLAFHVLQVHPSKVYSLIGSGGKKVKSIIEESGVEAIDMQDDGIVRSTGLCFFIVLNVFVPLFHHYSFLNIFLLCQGENYGKQCGEPGESESHYQWVDNGSSCW